MAFSPENNFFPRTENRNKNYFLPENEASAPKI